ncbi:hypothetical protein N9Y63_00475 [Akkermansiaceae bacterium]|nr:hypothetical protein [Akkermansiaceae bacterium]
MEHYSALQISGGSRGSFSRKRVLIGLVTILVSTTVAYFLWKNLRAKSYLEEARNLAESENWVGAFVESSKSLQSDPSLESARLVVKAARIIRSRDVYPRAVQLFEFQGATVEDRHLALEALLDFRELEIARKLADELTPQELKNGDIRYQLVRVALLAGNYLEAIKIADAEIVENQTEIDLLLAIHLAESGIQEVRRETDRRLHNVMSSNCFPLALRGFELLISIDPSYLPEDLMEQALARFEGSKELGPFNELHLESLKVQAGQQEWEVAISRAMQKFRDQSPIVLANWLAKFERYDELLKITCDSTFQEDERIFPLRLLALEKSKKWDELLNALEAPTVEFPEPLKLALVELAKDFQDGSRSKKNQTGWNMVLLKAESDLKRNWFHHISEIASRAGNREVQMDALARAVLHSNSFSPKTEAIAPLFDWLLGNDDKDRLLKISRLLFKNHPSHPIILERHIYLKALYEKVVPSDINNLKKMIKAYPDSLVLQRSLAFLQLKLDQPQEALDTLYALPWRAGTDNLTLAIRARVLFLINQEDTARKLAEEVDWSKLNAQEKVILGLPSLEELSERSLPQVIEARDIKSLRKYVSAYPNNVAFHRSLAFVQLKMNLPQDALETLGGLSRWLKPDNLTNAIRARALFETGQKKRARDFAKRINWGKLSSKETVTLKFPFSDGENTD